jgi:Co/Zn/Cd efflux system component
MALVADSFHMLSDIAALLIAFLSGTPTYTMSRLLTYSLLQKS